MKIFKIILTIAFFIAAPYLYLHVDKNSKSLSASILSQVALQPSEKESVQGLQITINGLPLVEPFHSVIELTNDGLKSIITSDFEVPLEIRLQSEAVVVGARVTGKSPEDIDAEISWDKESVQLKPMLLNPRDSISLSILTSGSLPYFTTKARIVGIQTVSLSDATKDTCCNNLWKKVISLFVAYLLISVSLGSVLAFYTSSPGGIVFRTFARLFAFSHAVTTLAAGIFTARILRDTSYDSFVYYIFLTCLLFALAYPFSLKLVRKLVPKDELS